MHLYWSICNCRIETQLCSVVAQVLMHIVDHNLCVVMCWISPVFQYNIQQSCIPHNWHNSAKCTWQTYANATCAIVIDHRPVSVVHNQSGNWSTGLQDNRWTSALQTNTVSLNICVIEEISPRSPAWWWFLLELQCPQVCLCYALCINWVRHALATGTTR